MVHKNLKSMGCEQPRIGVSALNPHCGESGLFGREEIDSIMPAIEDARNEQIDALGPFPGDTVFFKMNDVTELPNIYSKLLISRIDSKFEKYNITVSLAKFL